MAKDVAGRELDQAGFRISNLGDPKDASDATKVDTRSIPKPAVGSGSPGTSLLAAAADHVHPATDGGGPGAATITLHDPSTQSADTTHSVLWAQAVDFSELPGDKITCSLSAIVRVTEGATGKVELVIGGEIDKPDGTPVASFFADSALHELHRASGEIARPQGLTIVKVLAGVASAPGEIIVSGKTIAFRAATGA